MAHTPEERRIDRAAVNIRILDAQDCTICTVWHNPLDPPEWAKGNACLISSAPILLEVCKRLMIAVDNGKVKITPELGMQISNAILKAEDGK